MPLERAPGALKEQLAGISRRKYTWAPLEGAPGALKEQLEGISLKRNTWVPLEGAPGALKGAHEGRPKQTQRDNTCPLPNRHEMIEYS